jgi:hemolysin D
MRWQERGQWIVDQCKRLWLLLHVNTKSSAESWRYRRQAHQELFNRYKAVFAFWWERRDQIKLPDLKTHEAEFLPSVLALQTAPISPMGRWTARVLIVLFITLFLWSVFGKMDIIVNGQGKIIASGHSKAVASVEAGKVIALYVEEGQSVKKGDVLVELDARGPDSEQNKAEGDRQLALLQMERSNALLESLANNQEPMLSIIAGVDETHYKNEARHLRDLWHDYAAKRNRIISQIKRFGDALPLAARRAKDYKELAKERDVSEHSYLEKEQARIDLLGQLDDAKTQLAALTAEMRKTAQNDLYQATRIWSGAVQDVNKASAHSEQLRITAPVDGVVQQLIAHTVGGVVPAAQTLMFIVPSQHTVELEGYVENKDIGFMRKGQSAQVKIDAYEYSKYGTIAAVVTHISHDAVDFSGNGTGQFANKEFGSNKESAPGAKGLMYAVKVTLQNPSILVDGRQMPLLPGMSGSVEIKTGERRIIEYVLSPLITHARESLRER